MYTILYTVLYTILNRGVAACWLHLLLCWGKLNLCLMYVEHFAVQCTVYYSVHFFVHYTLHFRVKWTILYSLDVPHHVRWCKSAWLIMSRALPSLPSPKCTENLTIECTCTTHYTIYSTVHFSVIKYQSHWLNWLINSGAIPALPHVYVIYP